MKHLALWIGGILLGLILLLSLAMGGALLWLRSESGRQWAESKIAELTADSPTARVTMQGLGRGLPSSLALKELKIADRHGVWLSVRDIFVRISLADLLQRRIRLELVSASDVSLLRLPEGVEKEPPAQEPRGMFDLPDLSKLPEIRLEQVDIARIFLGQELAGKPASYTLHGQAATREGLTTATLEARRLERPADALTVKSRYDQRERGLFLDLRLDEAPGGFLAGLLGLPGEPDETGKTGKTGKIGKTGKSGVRLALRGDGPLKAWEGSLEASAGDLFALDSGLELSLEPPYRADLTARLRLNPDLLPAQAREILGSEAEFRLLANAKADGTMDLTGSGFQAQGLAVDLSGWLDLGQKQLDMTAETSMPRLEDLAKDQGLDLKLGSPLSVRLHGPLGNPHGSARARLAQLSSGGIRVDGVDILIQAARPKTVPGQNGLEARLSLALNSLSLTDGLVLPSVSLEALADTPDFESVNIPHLTVRSPGIELRATGHGRLSDPQAKARLELNLDDLARLAALLGPDLSGSVQLAADLDLAPQGALSAWVRATAHKLDGLPAPAQTLLGPRLELAGQARLEGSSLRLSSLTAQGRGAHMDANGWADLQAQDFELTFSARILEIALAARALDQDASGGLALDGTAKGSFERFALDAQLASDQLMLQTERLTDVRTTVNAAGLPKALQAGLALTAGTPLGRLEARSRIAHEAGQGLFVLEETRVELPGLNASSSRLGVHAGTGLLEGDIRVQASSLQAVSTFLETPLDARGNILVRLTPLRGQQNASLSADLEKIHAVDMRIATLRLRADAADLLGTPSGRADLDLREAVSGDIRLSTASLHADGDLSRVALRAEVEGEWLHPVKVSLAGSLRQEEPGWVAGLDHLQASLAETPVILQQPVELAHDGQGYRLGKLVFRLEGNGATVSATGSLEPGQASGRLSLDAFPAAMLPLAAPKPVAGHLGGELLLSGSLEEPVLGLELSARGVRFPDLEDAPAVNLDSSARYAQGHAEAKIRLLGGKGMSGNMTAALPLRLSLAPFQADLPPDGSLTGSMDASLDLSMLPLLLQWDDQLLAGTARLDMALSGSLSEPWIDGTLHLSDGRYQNLTSGTVLDRMRLTAQAKGQAVTLEQFTATDGGSGRVNATGSADFSDGLRYGLQARLRSATLLRMPEVISTASGDVSLSGDTTRTAINGNLILERTDVTVPQRLPPGIVEIEVKRINTPEGDAEQAEPQERPREGALTMDLDIGVRAPNQLFVRGHGLDAEFSGDLRVSGTTSNPRLLGVLSLVRGRFTFMGNTLTLQEGDIRFLDTDPPNPQLNVLASSTVDEVEARLRVTGSADDLQVEVSSVPPLPQDEVLARLLFGRAVGNLSPFQAIQLAQAVQQLRGGASGPDIQTDVRRFLGLDELTVGEADPAEGGGYVLEAGRYITDTVYLRLDKGITAEEDRMGVVVELTPSLNLESEAGTTSGMGLGLFWKKDY